MNSNAQKRKIVACIPAYNEERTIASVIVKTVKYVNEVVVCDDGSTDLTGDIAKALGAKVIKHEKNMGYGAALSSLFEWVKKENVDVMVTLDADGQHDPDDIPKLLAPILSGEADIVVGSRFISNSSSSKGLPVYRKFGIKMITKIVKTVSYSDITDAQSGFRAYNKRAIESINISEKGMGASVEILLKAKENNLKIIEVPVKITYDEHSSTHNPLIHGLDVMLSILRYVSMKRPLLFYGVPGFISMLVAICFWMWTIQIFTVTRQIVMSIVIIAFTSTITGLILSTTAIILWVFTSIVKEK